MKRNRTDIAAYIFFALLAATFLELLLAVGPFIVMVSSAVMIYYGLKRMDRKKGKWLFYSGLVLFIFALLSSTFFMLTLFGLLFYLMYLFWEKARKPHVFNVTIDDEATSKKTTLRKAFFFRNIILAINELKNKYFQVIILIFKQVLVQQIFTLRIPSCQKEIQLSLFVALLAAFNYLCLMMQVFQWNTRLFLVNQMCLIKKRRDLTKI